MAIGLLLAASAWHDEQWWLLIVAAVLVFQSAQNMGCSAGACAIPPAEDKPKDAQDPI